MKRTSAFLVSLIAASFAVHAQSTNGIQFSASSGYAFPSSPMTFSDLWKVKMGGSLLAGYELQPGVVVSGSVEYYEFVLDNAAIEAKYNTDYMRKLWFYDNVTLKSSAKPTSVFTASANVHISPFNVTGIAAPYVVVGFGLMRFSLSEVPLTFTNALTMDSTTLLYSSTVRITGSKQTSLMAQFGVGIDIRVSSMIVPFIEARHVVGLVRGVGNRYTPVTAGIKIRL